VAPKTQDTIVTALSQSEFQALLQEQLRTAVRLALVAILEAEVEEFVGALPYQRTDQRRDQRNGHYTRDLETTVGLIEDLSVPRTRKGFHTQLFDSYKRRRAELDAAISGMFIGGISDRGVGGVIQTLTASKPSPSTVSRVFHTLDGEYERWKSRPLDPHYRYAFADGTYFTVIYEHQGCKMPVLAVVGVTLAGERDVLGFSVGDRENQSAWEALFADLKARGVVKVDLWITDGHQATINALDTQFPGSARQCQFAPGNVPVICGKTVPSLCGQSVPVVCSQDVPPTSGRRSSLPSRRDSTIWVRRLSLGAIAPPVPAVDGLGRES